LHRPAAAFVNPAPAAACAPPPADARRGAAPIADNGRMANRDRTALDGTRRAALERLAGDLLSVFGDRLQAVVAYGLATAAPGDPVHTLALVTSCTVDDLAACARAADEWDRANLAAPLVLERQEFDRSLDAFPFEYRGILDDHVVIAGPPPFAATRIADADLRRACERQATSHLIHLREGFIETGGDPAQITGLLQSSAAPFRTLLTRIAQLTGAPPASVASDEDLAAFAEASVGIPAAVVLDVFASGRAGGIADPTATLAPYLAAVTRIWAYLDTWQPA
jgi:hypothetical protein